MDNFFAYLESHLEKAYLFLKNIWFRGSIVITKKFKLFQRKKDGHFNRRWTFKASEPDNTQSDLTPQISRSGFNLNKDTTIL